MNQIFTIGLIRCFFVLALFQFESCATDPLIGDLYISNVTSIDAISGLKENQTVVIKDDKIVKIGTAGTVKIPDQANEISGSGKFLIPGLWDAHVHFAYIEELAPSMFDLFLRYGVTSVRDTGGKIQFVKEWQNMALENPNSAPRVMIAGPLIDGEPNVYDGSTPSRPELSVGADDVSDIEKIIRRLDSIGVDHLKAYEMLSQDQFTAVANIARERGLKVTGHVPLSMDVISASNAGMNSMEHLRNLEFSCASNSDELLKIRKRMLAQGQLDEGGVLRSRIHAAQRQEAIKNQDEDRTEEVLEALFQNDTWQIPTLSIMTGMSQRPFAREEWQQTFDLLPDSVKERWITGVESVLENEPPESSVIYSNWTMNMVDRISKKGIPILAGTDCPIFFLTPGRSLHEELELLVQSGLTPLEAIKSATLRPAEYFSMEDELGLIAEGMIADLVLLDDNPLEDIRHTRDIVQVIKNGTVYQPLELSNTRDRLPE